MSGNIHDCIASPELNHGNEANEFEANLNDSKRQCVEAPIPQNPENDLQANAIEEEAPRAIIPAESLIILGPSGTTVKKNDFERIQWFSVAFATRNLLTLLFDEQTLATHTISRLSHTFHYQERVMKPTLDFEKVSDTIYCIQRKFGCSEMEVRLLIIMTCSNMARTLQARRI